MSAIFGLHENYLSIEFPSNDLDEAIGAAQEAVFFLHTMPMFVWKLMRLFRIGRERELLKAVKNNRCALLRIYFSKAKTLDSRTGKDTIASGLIWFFWLVSKAPSVEKNILEELKLLLSLKMGQLSEYHDWPWVFHSDDTNGLVYLHAALCESLRLYPPVPINSKTVLNEVVLPDGSLIKPGTQPERWVDGDGKLTRHENASKFFTFNIGPGTCLG
ncbi:hypothetical protein C5167_017534 [Papaver somniferum]|uniref:Cytochrome P450 n=1 Tax=Papaver somniferum TaxID=3469 RepID=A0A4Y7IK76_PAPSO|nr:hypothetical protein C5167_017534 [Papaver somniferum]